LDVSSDVFDEVSLKIAEKKEALVEYNNKINDENDELLAQMMGDIVKIDAAIEDCISKLRSLKQDD